MRGLRGNKNIARIHIVAVGVIFPLSVSPTSLHWYLKKHTDKTMIVSVTGLKTNFRINEHMKQFFFAPQVAGMEEENITKNKLVALQHCQTKKKN